MSFDPAMISTMQAALVARVDFQQFTLATQSPTQLRSGLSSIQLLGSSNIHPLQEFFGPTTASTVQISWQGVYRGEAYAQPPLIVDTIQEQMGIAAVLDGALKFLDLIDLRASRDGANPNVYAPKGVGP